MLKSSTEQRRSQVLTALLRQPFPCCGFAQASSTTSLLLRLDLYAVDAPFRIGAADRQEQRSKKKKATMGVNLCFIARVADGMLLVASTDPMRSSDSQETMDVYKSQAKQILAGLTERSPSKCSIDSGPFAFHYVISDAVVYLAMTPKSYPKRAIFRYLGEVAQEFVQEVTATCNGGDWRQAVATVGRPYAYIQFDRRLQAKRRQYADPRRVGAASQLDADLADIHSIMRRNIDEVLNRGERLDALVETSQTLRSEAGKYKWGAKKFSLMVAWQQYAPLICLGAVVAFVVYLKVRF